MLNCSRGIIVGASSDIGLELCKNFLEKKIDIVGTYRKKTNELFELENCFKALYQCDFSSTISVDNCAETIISNNFDWNFLIFCPGTMEPIGKFSLCDIDAWSKNININFINQMRLLYRLIPFKAKNIVKDFTPNVIFFAGGGTNSTPIDYSCYTISKIALIKAVELLDAEYEDIAFTILGPGWVKTKIHTETLNAGVRAGLAKEETCRRLKSCEFTTMSQIASCCEWVLSSSKSIVGGRNFSIVHDDWGSIHLNNTLIDNKDMYKLRRYMNNYKKNKKKEQINEQR